MFWVQMGGVLAFLGVALGAFGAHALRSRLSPDLQAIYETGVRYHLYHALALFVVAWLSETRGSALVNLSGWTFVIGIVLFSGSLYLLSLSGLRGWGAVTPFGGVAFLAGWVLLVLAAFQPR
jgi:uncharacterized membrane protein YgdD (TMEM256/DUF423 family)